MRTNPLFLLLLVAAGCNGGTPGVLSVAGQIEGKYVDVGSRVGGRVLAVHADEGDRVAPGGVLVALESEEAEAGVAAARAQLAQTQATLDKVRAGARAEQIEQALAAVSRAREQYRLALNGPRPQEVAAARNAADTARAQRDQAKADYERLAALFEKNAISQRLYEQALHTYEGAQAQLEAALNQVRILEEGARDEEIQGARAVLEQAEAALAELRNGARPEDIAAAEAARDAAEAAVARAEAVLREMTVTAPSAGVVESLDLRPGDIVKPGAFARITDPDDLELVVYVSALYLGHLQLGDAVPLTTDAFGDERFEGRIIHIAAQGEFTPRNLQTEEERAQQVFGIKLKLDSNGGRLKAGMSATAHFDVRDRGPAGAT